MLKSTCGGAEAPMSAATADSCSRVGSASNSGSSPSIDHMPPSPSAGSASQLHHQLIHGGGCFTLGATITDSSPTKSAHCATSSMHVQAWTSS
eukprot:495271-Amphidinium_carterae.1